MPNITNNQKLKEEVTVAQIPLSFIRFLEKRANERVLEIVVVYEGVDRWDTIIKPEGMRTDPKVVIVDYNHRGIATGAYVRNFRVVDNYKLDDGTVLKRALIADLHIPDDAEMFYSDKGTKKSNGSLYEAVNKGQVPSVSVEFKPYKGKQTTDIRTGITTFHEWDLIHVSLLDVAPGQPYSGYKIIRSYVRTMNLNDIIKTKLSELDEPLIVDDVIITATFEVDGEQYNAMIEVGESLEDVKVTNVEMREAPKDAVVPDAPKDDVVRAEPPVEDSKVVELPKEERKEGGYEELRGTISELTKRMESLETSISESITRSNEDKPKGDEDEDEEARVRAIADKYINQAKTKVDSVAGDGKRQLGDSETSVQSFTPDDMQKQIRKARLLNTK